MHDVSVNGYMLRASMTLIVTQACMYFGNAIIILNKKHHDVVVPIIVTKVICL